MDEATQATCEHGVSILAECERCEAAKAQYLFGILTGRIPVCPECGGKLIYAADVDVRYCTDASCLWNQDEFTRRVEAKYV